MRVPRGSATVGLPAGIMREDCRPALTLELIVVVVQCPLGRHEVSFISSVRGKRLTRTRSPQLGGVVFPRFGWRHATGARVSPAMYAEVYVVALSPQRDPMYEVILTTTVDRLREDGAILERILRRWKFVGR